VTPGGGDLEGPSCLVLTADVAEVDLAGTLAVGRGLVDLGRLPGVAKEPDDLGERLDRHDPKAVDLGRLEGVGGRHHHALQPRASRRYRFTDYVRLGFPLTIVMVVMIVITVPIVWGW
jgi:hypothetical protein